MNKARRDSNAKRKTQSKRKPTPRQADTPTRSKRQPAAESIQAPGAKRVNMTLQGKGGVGKSIVSSLLAQYYMENNQPVVCYDTDAVNATLSGYQALSVRPVELMAGGHLNARQFDVMMASILSEACHFVIDNGTSTFIPLLNYLIENQAVAMITEAGKQVMIHCVITGGQGLPDTLNGFSQLASQLPESAPIMVWLNEYFGEIGAAGQAFEEMTVYAQHSHRVAGIVRMPRVTASTFGKDLALILDRRLTFGEAQHSDQFGPMSRQRLAMVKRSFFDQLALVI